MSLIHQKKSMIEFVKNDFWSLFFFDESLWWSAVLLYNFYHIGLFWTSLGPSIIQCSEKLCNKDLSKFAKEIR